MNTQDLPRFAASLTAMAVLFDKPITPQVTEIYFRALQHFTIDEVEAGISKSCHTLKFFPRPVELTEAVAGGSANIEDKAMTEACRVLEAIKAVGTYRTVVFDDPVTQAVIVQQFGGWSRFSELREDEEKWFIKDFAAGYKAFARMGIKHYGALPGIAANQNALTGRQWAEQPALIGDTQKALAVRSQGAQELPPAEGFRNISEGLRNWSRPEREVKQ